MKRPVSFFREIARRRKPRGCAIIERGKIEEDYFAAFLNPEFKDNSEAEEMPILAWACFEKREIVCRPIVCRQSLYIYLHEVGHVVMRHDKNPNDTPLWEEEFEAEQWAIKAMRAEGVPVPRQVLRAAKHYVRACVNSKTNDEAEPEHISRWCKQTY